MHGPHQLAQKSIHSLALRAAVTDRQPHLSTATMLSRVIVCGDLAQVLAQAWLQRRRLGVGQQLSDPLAGPIQQGWGLLLLP